MSEAGVPGFDVSAWYAFFAPAKTPHADHPQVPCRHRQGAGRSRDQARLDQLGVGDRRLDARRSLARILKSEMDKWGVIIKEAGIKVEG